MIAASLIGIVCGAILGSRFRVPVLLPVMTLAVGVATATSLLGIVSSPGACIDLLGWGLGLELAYAAIASLGRRRCR